MGGGRVQCSIKSPSAPFVGPRCFMEDFKLPDRRKLATTPITNVRIDGAHSSFQILRGIFSLRTRSSRSPEVARRACNRHTKRGTPRPMAESQRATHRVLLPYELVDGCLCAATTHAEVLEQKSWFEFDMSLARRARPSASNEAQPLFRTFVGPAEKSVGRRSSTGIPAIQFSFALDDGTASHVAWGHLAPSPAGFARSAHTIRPPGGGGRTHGRQCQPRSPNACTASKHAACRMWSCLEWVRSEEAEDLLLEVQLAMKAIE